MTGLSNCRDRFGGKLLEVKTGVFCFSKGPGYSVGWFDFMVSGMVLTNFNGSGVGFGFGVGCGFGIGWGFGGKSLQTLGLGVGGGCGIGLGLGWGFGTAYGTHYVDSTIMFEGIDFEKAKTPRNKSGDLSKLSQDQAE